MNPIMSCHVSCQSCMPSSAWMKGDRCTHARGGARARASRWLSATARPYLPQARQAWLVANSNGYLWTHSSQNACAQICYPTGFTGSECQRPQLGPGAPPRRPSRCRPFRSTAGARQTAGQSWQVQHVHVGVLSCARAESWVRACRGEWRQPRAMVKLLQQSATHLCQIRTRGSRKSCSAVAAVVP